MTCSDNDLSTVIVRLERLERQSRRIRWSALAALIVLGASYLLIHPQGRSVEAQRFVVRDTHGEVRAELGILKHPVDGSEQVGLVIGRKKDAMPPRSQGFISVALEEGSPILSFHGAGATGDILLRAPEGGIVGLELLGAKSDLDLHITPEGSSSLELNSQHATAWLVVPEHGKPELVLKER